MLPTFSKRSHSARIPKWRVKSKRPPKPHSTITGKPLKDQAEAKNLAHAIDYLEDLAANPRTPIRELDIRQIHGLILRASMTRTPVSTEQFQWRSLFLSLRLGESVKRTWFFRVDFKSGDKSARYLFFFGYAHPQLRSSCDATLLISREDPPGSYYYRRLDSIDAPNVPRIVEIGYLPAEERFVARERSGAKRDGRVEELGRRFFEEVVRLHFSS